MTPARDAALARQAQELAEGEIVSAELPIVRELREEIAKDQGHRRAWIAVIDVLSEVAPNWRANWPDGKSGIDLAVSAIRGLAIDADELARLREENERYRDALAELAKPKGRYSRDPLTHAHNVIEDMAECAHRALAARAAEGATDHG